MLFEEFVPQTQSAVIFYCLCFPSRFLKYKKKYKSFLRLRLESQLFPKIWETFLGWDFFISRAQKVSSWTLLIFRIESPVYKKGFFLGKCKNFFNLRLRKFNFLNYKKRFFRDNIRNFFIACFLFLFLFFELGKFHFSKYKKNFFWGNIRNVFRVDSLFFKLGIEIGLGSPIYNYC